VTSAEGNTDSKSLNQQGSKKPSLKVLCQRQTRSRPTDVTELRNSFSLPQLGMRHARMDILFGTDQTALPAPTRKLTQRVTTHQNMGENRTQSCSPIRRRTIIRSTLRLLASVTPRTWKKSPYCPKTRTHAASDNSSAVSRQVAGGNGWCRLWEIAGILVG
jgi:hypothetical protein